ncbi:MAG TPA: carboxymuconolactone decarboxylase family protein [Chthoniobacter sp.]|nr:carboxymuconolactone decarboxylase family protein [Chthoniobacter sp.]
MSLRINYRATASDTVAALYGVKTHLEKVFPDHRLKALVELRTSQINGCAYCVDMHSKDARKAGETQQRLDCLCVWREVSFFTPRERAALALAEAITLISVDHVPDDVFAEVRAHFTEREIVDLVMVISVMNAWNRLSITMRSVPEPDVVKD